MEQQLRSIPRPLVRTNQWVIVLSVLFTWLTGQSWMLLIPLVSGVLGLLFGFNPLMRLAKRFLRKRPSDYLQEDWDQQQFNQVIAVVCLAVAYAAYLAHWLVVAYVFTTMVAVAAFVAILGFCFGCFIRYQWNQYRYRKSLKNS
jgi:hypothetical protein